MIYETIKVRLQDSVCFVQFDRPEANNTICGRLVEECHDALSAYEDSATVVVVSGSPEIFCLGADFADVTNPNGDRTQDDVPSLLYDLWLRLATGPYVTIAQVRGRVNAGGIGFVAACDIALGDVTAQLSLSELLFGLYPACVLPFLIHRIGFQKAHYLTLTTQPISGTRACEMGLLDGCESSVDRLLQRHLQRLRLLSKNAIRSYKAYVNRITVPLRDLKSPAVAANRDLFSDARNLHSIRRYVEHGVFPWESM
jgi:polyketide biosynthesis enoyl-CoA hydratase PksH